MLLYHLLSVRQIYIHCKYLSTKDLELVLILFSFQLKNLKRGKTTKLFVTGRQSEKIQVNSNNLMIQPGVRIPKLSSTKTIKLFSPQSNLEKDEPAQNFSPSQTTISINKLHKSYVQLPSSTPQPFLQISHLP